jgi:3',5'-nucleoside bisphosphate phosphatase
MPSGQPFTALCRAATQPATTGRADLHVHSTYSDGAYTPAEIVSLAERSGLTAVALTDHDTLDGIMYARAAAVGTSVEVVPAVEITTEHGGRELHLLGYFVNVDDVALGAALDRLRAQRRERFLAMVERLQARGVQIPSVYPDEKGTLGRRHLAVLLVKARRAATIREAFARYLNDPELNRIPKLRLPTGDAIALVRGAGGVAAWAHPSYDGTEHRLRELQRLGLEAVEAEYPGHRLSLVRSLRQHADELRLAVTGGSDCHGPGPVKRAIGAVGVNATELEALRQRANGKQRG